MTDFIIEKATKTNIRLRVLIEGLPKSGKTWTSLLLASFFPPLPGRGKGTAVIDTEHRSARKYSDVFNFDVLELKSYSPEIYVEAIHELEKRGYDRIIIDSLSHEWKGKDGALQQVDRAAKRSQSQNTFLPWADVTPRHDSVFETILDSPCDIFATLRVKTIYVVEQDLKGKAVPRRIGLSPIQRPDGAEYEFDVIGRMDMENTMVIEGRCPALHGQVIRKPGEYMARALMDWQTDTTRPTLGRADGPSDQAWAEWLALKERAHGVRVQYPNVNRTSISQTDLRLEYAQLQARVKVAESRVPARPQ